MRSIESEGDPIDQAIERALRALDVARDQLQSEIGSAGTGALLGWGGKKARVRARFRPPLASRLLGLEHEAPGMDSRETLPPAEYGQPGPAASTQPPAAGASHGATVSEAFQLKCKGTLEAILSRLDASCVVEAGPGPDPGSVLLTVSGDSGGLLIGRPGPDPRAPPCIVNRVL